MVPIHSYRSLAACLLARLALCHWLSKEFFVCLFHHQKPHNFLALASTYSMKVIHNKLTFPVQILLFPGHLRHYRFFPWRLPASQRFFSASELIFISSWLHLENVRVLPASHSKESINFTKAATNRWKYVTFLYKESLCHFYSKMTKFSAFTFISSSLESALEISS